MTVPMILTYKGKPVEECSKEELIEAIHWALAENKRIQSALDFALSMDRVRTDRINYRQTPRVDL